MPQRKRRTLQFSLTTLLLMSAAVSCAASASVMLWNNRAKRDSSPRVFRVIRAIGEFCVDHGRFPTAEEGLDVLAKPDASPTGRYLNPTDAVDLWGNELVYVVLVDHDRTFSYDLLSFGPNGIDDGGTGDDFSVIYDIDIALSNTKLSDSVAWLIAGSFILTAMGIARECRYRNVEAEEPTQTDSCEAPP